MTILPPKLLAAITAQQTHFCIGLLVVFGAALFFPGIMLAMVLSVYGLMGIVLVKEAFFDPYAERGAPFLWGGVIDAGWYVVGIAFGVFLLTVTGKW